MKLKEATDILEKDKACAEQAMECIDEKKECSSCEYFTDYKLEEARWTALRVMQAWEKAKSDIRKACGCTTALDIMEKYQKEAEEVTCITCGHIDIRDVQGQAASVCFCRAKIWEEIGKQPHVIGHDPHEPIRCDHWEAKKEGKT